MQGKGAGKTTNKICPVCGKRIVEAGRLGSLTSYLFGGADCSCSGGGPEAKVRSVSGSSQVVDDFDFCPKCGLKIDTNSRDGSLTGFLFQSTRCKCPPDKAFDAGKMTAKLWKLKQAGGDTIFTSAPNKDNRGFSSSIDLAPGATIGGAYEIIKLIGRGGMGEVYLARHEALNKKCALKVIPPEQVTELGWMRFQLEAKAVAKLDHINLVRVTDLGIHEGCLPFYAMDYVEGQNLSELLAEHGPMPVKTMLEIFVQVCDGVECAHNGGLVHRDLKPANIMVATSKTGALQAKVLDFGLAKLTRHDRSMQSLTKLGDLFGSPFYMSPEQCNGDKLDNRSDIYSLGCTIFECLTGQAPFTSHVATAVMFSHLEADPPSLESIVGPGKVPFSMEVIVAKLLRKNPLDRYQTLSQLRSDLELVALGKDVQPIYVSRDKKGLAAKAEDPATEVPPTKQPNYRLLALSGLLLLVLGGSFTYFFFSKKPLLDHNRVAMTLRQGHPGESTPTGGEVSAETMGAQSPSGQTSTATCKLERGPDGKSNFVFRFPNDLELGTFVDSQFPRGRLLATGEVQWAADRQPLFLPSEAFLKDPANLDVFQPNHLGGLDLRKGLVDQKDSKLLRHVGLLTGLRSLDLEDSDIIDADLEEVKKLTHLESLSVSRTSITGAALARLPQLRQLTWLNFRACQGVSALLASLKGCDKLEGLKLDEDLLTASDFKTIGTMSGLRTLEIDNCRMTTSDLISLTSLPRLAVLHCSAYKISLAAIAPLKIMRKNGLEDLTVDATGVSENDKDMILEVIRGARLRVHANARPGDYTFLEK